MAKEGNNELVTCMRESIDAMTDDEKRALLRRWNMYAGFIDSLGASIDGLARLKARFGKYGATTTKDAIEEAIETLTPAYQLFALDEFSTKEFGYSTLFKMKVNREIFDREKETPGGVEAMAETAADEGQKGNDF